MDGGLLLAIWNDFDGARLEAYEEWHSREHVPERVSVAGFHGGTRLRNDALPRHRYLTLYEIASAKALAGPEYADLLAHPTSCSTSMRPGFRDFLRMPMEVVRSEGWGLCGFVSVVGSERALCSGAVTALMQLRDVSGALSVHVARRAEAVVQVPWAHEAEARAIESLVLVEAVTSQAAETARRMAGSIMNQSDEPAAEDFANTVYQAVFHFPGRSAAERQRHRRAHWSACDG